ncbi:filamentous hemagglutinin N-terminal domain-containing protein [Burkholderia sp. 22PA0106]|uniref:two-partner secretion domain-containing protein n=1 Tax=Burkholderia sp. 22PA0106 TaxID=3237371 RepID=UPI0039C2F2F5
MAKKMCHLRPVAFAVLVLLANQAHAVGVGTIASGTGNISKNGATTTVNQSTDKMVVNWNNMDVRARETLNFVQKDAKSAVLNRINSFMSPTQINGALNANGRVLIVNPNGVVIGNGARVNVGGLIASSLDISDENFNNGKLKFSGDKAGVVYVGGRVAAKESVGLFGTTVVNNGAIRSENGNVVLGAAQDVTVSFDGGRMQARLDQAAVHALVENNGLIKTDNGDIVMTAWARDAVARNVINNTGTLEADGLDKLGGITLLGKGHGNIGLSGKQDGSSDSVVSSEGDINLSSNLKTRGNLALRGNNVIATEYTAGPDLLGARRHAILAGGDVVIDTHGGNIRLGDVSGKNVSVVADAGAVTSQAMTAHGSLTMHAGKDLTYGGNLVAGGKISLAGENVKAGVLPDTWGSNVGDSDYFGTPVSWNGFGAYGQSFYREYAKIKAADDVVIDTHGGNIRLGDVSGKNVSVVADAGAVTSQAMTAHGSLTMHAGKDLTYGGNLVAGGKISLAGENVKAGVLPDTWGSNVGDSDYFGTPVSWNGFGAYGQSFYREYAKIKAADDVVIDTHGGNIRLGDVSGKNVSVVADAGAVTSQAMTAHGSLTMHAGKDLTYGGNLLAGGQISLAGENVTAGVLPNIWGSHVGKRAAIDSRNGDVIVKAGNKAALGAIAGMNADVSDAGGKVSLRWHSHEYGNMYGFDEVWPSDAKVVGLVEGFDGIKPLVPVEGGYIVATENGPKFMDRGQVYVIYSRS